MGINQELGYRRFKNPCPQECPQGAQPTSLFLLPCVQSADSWDHPLYHLPSTWVSWEMETRLKTQRSLAYPGLPRFTAPMAGFALMWMKRQSAMFVCLTQRKKKHVTWFTSHPFPTPFCGCNWKPTSLKDLEQGLGQGGDNLYLIEKKSVLSGRGKLPNLRSNWPNQADLQLPP